MRSCNSKVNVLIVEDEQLIAHSIERSLLMAGFSIAGVVASAQEVFEHVERAARFGVDGH